ncbi:hypothetical protein ACO22_07617 [Paracoccidioides brasiliensis]|uniref:Uncharacterized protein n=1 Tax=Paracoccidioides brasiliensis TaxID=121759 RepID=A0A1D2J4K5_PARBR|nr:hypothetical protein ACO22_07617 [Paracoccidioides brasiliensis]ODH46286.1 hypothetical protein GX48_07628 [Paracoccidioides brasiliensis]
MGYGARPSTLRGGLGRGRDAPRKIDCRKAEATPMSGSRMSHPHPQYLQRNNAREARSAPFALMRLKL